MGDLNSVDVSQVCHEGVPRTKGGLSPEHQLSHGKPVPRSETLQGVYIDDHLIVGVVPKSLVSDNDMNLDMTLLRRSREAYERAGLDPAKRTTFEKATRFTAW
eukprot:14177832-Heterocapsa_arctica.AAC.1